MAKAWLRSHFCAPAGAAAVLGILACSITWAAAAAAQQTAQSAKPAEKDAPQGGGITEDELRQLLAGKTFYLRGGYLDDALSFDEHGGIIGRPARGSYTLCLIEIDKVRLTKHKVELDGIRYGLHFLGALPYEDPTKAVDRVRITPEKKVQRISIDRELVVKPKKRKKSAAEKGPSPAAAAAGSADADELKGEIAAAAPSEQLSEQLPEQLSDMGGVTTTTSPAHSAEMLKDALKNIFAAALDARMIAAMPDFWKLYYQAAAAKTDFRPSDAAVERQSTVDRKARLLTGFEAESNEYAQQAGVAGVAMYHAVIGRDGKAEEIAVGRPIGFGLDENAVAAIRKAKFEPAMKGGKPVPVLLDLVVEFRIYSKRTAASSAMRDAEKPPEPSLPGPYSVQHPQ